MILNKERLIVNKFEIFKVFYLNSSEAMKKFSLDAGFIKTRRRFL